MGAALLRSAMAMVDDPVAAVAQCNVTAFRLASRFQREAEGRDVALGDGDLFRLLRQAYHSIGRSHSPRRTRDALATSLAAQPAHSPVDVDG